MATYAVGDLQGCFDSLQALLQHVAFGDDDVLWLVGDIVNRGPRSLDALRFVKSLGPRGVTVLGNHDLHLVALARGFGRNKGKDTLTPILSAPDREELIAWLMHQPLLHHQDGWTMVHAGLSPQWDLSAAKAAAAELQAVLQGDEADAFLAEMYGNQPDRWDASLKHFERWRYITNAFTRMRYVSADGRLNLREKRPPCAETTAQGLMPWFAHPERENAGERVVFGHWATLQFDEPLDPAHGVYHLDNGCVWGRQLSALRLDDGSYFHVPACD